jgi:diketogulonate reductase-like aldo/keto reductase
MILSPQYYSRSVLLALFFLSTVVEQDALTSVRPLIEGLIDDIPTTTLNNGQIVPLVGLSVENHSNGRVAKLTEDGIREEHRIRLIDTSHNSNNEESVARGIRSGVRAFLDEANLSLYRQRRVADADTDADTDGMAVQVHVVTKVHYTHLGYERTKLSVQESLGLLEEAAADPHVDLKVHVLLSWPRCYQNIESHDCDGEEEALAQHVKEAGPAPHLTDVDAWKSSWKALEEMYNDRLISSIGVSNFHQGEMEELLQMATVKPHIVQMNVWSLLNDPKLVDLCYRENIHIQIFDIVHGVFAMTKNVPHAHHHLKMVANLLGKDLSASSEDEQDENDEITVSQVILKWLMHFEISVVPILPIPVDEVALREYSAVSVAKIPDLSDDYMNLVARSTEAVLLNEDLEEDAHVKVTFHADNRDL